MLLTEIEKYKGRAARESFNDFFKKRMNNEQGYKRHSNRYDIVLEDSSFIYYGIIKYNLNEEVYVTELYKTNRPHTISIFPKYKEIEGYHIRRKTEDIAPKIIWFEGYASYAYSDIDIRLEADSIIVVRDRYERKDFIIKKSAHHLLCFDKNDLSLFYIKELSKPTKK